MAKVSQSHLNLPPAAQEGLVQLGSRLSAARRQREITVREMAKRTQVSPSTITRLERGDTGISLGVLMAALCALDIHERLALLVDTADDPSAADNE